MILPIYIYGTSILREVAQDIDVETYPNLSELIDNMFETMYNADGIGLAGTQVGLKDRLFVVDLSPLADDEHPEFKDFKKAFINPRILERSGDIELVEEGCLSLPGIHEKVPREEEIHIQYIDENLQPRDERYSGFMARVLQHEYDHLDGIVFVDRISPLRKRMVKGKLASLAKGKVNCTYKVRTTKV